MTSKAAARVAWCLCGSTVPLGLGGNAVYRIAMQAQGYTGRPK